jgi:hypothetical protein
MVRSVIKSHNLKKELLCLKMLQYNSNIWKTKCHDNYKQYRFMVDNQEYFLWKNYGVQTILTDKKELEMKINHLGKIFHNPQMTYHLQNNGQLLFSSVYTLKPIKIGNSVLENTLSNNIQFPSFIEKKNTTVCSGVVENLNYLQNLMYFLKIL